MNSNVICEKPLVLNPWNANLLMSLEKETGKKVNNILQLRLHPSIIALKRKIEQSASSDFFEFDLTYITPRGDWYYTSWKGDEAKSGGIITNIGIHFFDMLIWLFGEVKSSKLHVKAHDRASGFLELSKARIRWFLSINEQTLPESARSNGIKSYRSMILDGKEIVFDIGFNNLHTTSYKQILDGNGFGILEALPSIELVHSIRNQEPLGLIGDFHPLATKKQTVHPFLKNDII